MDREPIYWGHPDEEHLTCVDPDEAIEEIIDGYYGEGEATEDVLRDLGEVSVTGFAHAELNRESVAEMMLEDTLERIGETYGDPDGEGDQATDAMKSAALVCADAIIADYRVWLCEPVTEYKVNALEWVKENRPDWLEEDRK
jgi:hypothetical protein